MTNEQRSSQPPQGQFDPDYYVQWQPPIIPPGQGRRVVRNAIAFLSAVLVFIALTALWRSNLIALPGGRGDIVGRVAAPAGGAVVFTGTDLTEIPVAADGSFIVRGVRSGRQILYVAFAGTAWEVAVDVPNQGTVDVGVITVQPTAEPVQR